MLKSSVRILILCLILSAGVTVLEAAETFEPGRIIEKVICQHQPDESYALYLPKGYSAQQKWPVLMALEPGARVLIPVKLYQKAADTYGYIVMCPTNVRNGPRQPIAKAIHAVWMDINKRFSIDKNRVYATGFSGGSRMSSFMHLITKSPVRGIIGVGAGISEALKAEQVRFTHYFGICGYADFNYSEMFKLEKTLANQGTPHRFYFYSALHRWPPEEIVTRAVEWLELMAMKEDIIPKDDRLAFIQKSFEKEVKAAGEREQKGEIFYAAGDYSAIARVFDSLVTADKLKPVIQKAAELKQSKEYKKFDKAENKRLEDEHEYIRKFVGGFNHLRGTAPKSVRLPKLMTAMGVPALVRMAKKKDKDPYNGSMAERILYNLTSKARMEGEDLMKKGDLDRAELFWQIGVEAGQFSWFNALMHFRLACVYAQKGKTKKALKTLQAAVKNGFNRPDILAREKSWDSLRSNGEFNKIIESLKKQ